MIKYIILIMSFFMCSTSCANENIKVNYHALIKKGKGSPLVILHGGPGLEHSYLLEGLMPLSEYRTLIFYDQGSYLEKLNDHKNITVQSLTEELKSIVEEFNGDYGLVVHSAGSIILFEFLKNTPKYLHPKEVIFITPLPLSWEVFNLDNLELKERIPAVTWNKIQELKGKPETCLQSLDYIFPYFFYSGEIHDVKFKRYDCILRNKLLSEVKDYNYVESLSLLPKQTIWISGEKEVFSKESYIKKWHIIPYSAHFPFVENKYEFHKVIKEFFGY